MSLLEARNVSRLFGRLVAVSGVSLAIEPGEFRAIIGPNGAGKTTFFNLISGLFPPTSGAILFDGEDITGMTPKQRVDVGMARTFQITEIFPELSIADNLRIAVEVAAGFSMKVWLGRAQRREVDARVDELLGLSNLADKKGRNVGALTMATSARPRS
jgi:branched-chain amino acid transport system ATP-binding protein